MSGIRNQCVNGLYFWQVSIKFVTWKTTVHTVSAITSQKCLILDPPINLFNSVIVDNFVEKNCIPLIQIIYLIRNVSIQIKLYSLKKKLGSLRFSSLVILITRYTIEQFLLTLNHSYGRNWCLNEVSNFSKYLSNLLLYYMYQLPV